MAELIEVPNENILDYHNFYFLSTSTGYFEEDIIFFNDVESFEGYLILQLGTIDCDEFVISCEFLTGTTSDVLYLKNLDSGVTSDFVTDSVSGYVECTDTGVYRIFFSPGTSLSDVSMRIWANEGTEAKAYQKYGETYYEEVETDMEVSAGTLVLDYDVSQMFKYSNIVTSSCMPLVYILAGFALGFSIIYALKNTFNGGVRL